jgi:hypothetical protein
MSHPAELDSGVRWPLSPDPTVIQISTRHPLG